MPKNARSSASSATRKKHARKPGGLNVEIAKEVPSKKKGKGRDASEPPKRKAFIPPFKPGPARVDPLDSLGLANSLDKDLVVTLRKLAKKDTITKTRGLEELKEWAQKSPATALISVLPVWIHHFPSLFLHSSRRIRLVTASLHHYLLADALNRAEFISQLLGTDTQQSETLIGSWCLAACDLDRHVSREARKSFDEILTWPARSDSEAEPGKLNLSDLLATSLADFLAKTILNPSALYTLIYASPVIPANLPQLSDKHTSSTDGNTTPRRAEAEEETTEEMQSRFRIGALGGTKWFLDTCPAKNAELLSALLEPLLSNPYFFSSLYHGSKPPFLPDLEGPGSAHAFGFEQPHVRRSAWGTIQSLLTLHREHPVVTLYLNSLSSAILRSAFVEPDVGVKGTMWEPLLLALTRIPNVWLLEPSAGEDTTEVESNDKTQPATSTSKAVSGAQSQAYVEFLKFLQLGCNGSPQQGYPTVVIILSTLPTEILPLSHEALTEFFTLFWSAVDGRVFFGSLEQERKERAAAFLASYVECVGYVSRWLWTQAKGGASEDVEYKETAKRVLKEQLDIVFNGIMDGSLSTSESVVGPIISKALLRLATVDQELLQIPLTCIDSSTSSTSARRASGLDPVRLLSAVHKQLVLATDGEVIGQGVEAIVLRHTRDVIHALMVHVVGNPRDAAKDASALELILAHFDGSVRRDADLVHLIDGLIVDRLSIILHALESTNFATLAVAFITYRQNTGTGQDFWHQVLTALRVYYPHGQDKVCGVLTYLANHAMSPNWVNQWILPRGGELDVVFEDQMEVALQGRSEPAAAAAGALMRLILPVFKYFMSRKAFVALNAILASTIAQCVSQLVTATDISTEQLTGALSLLQQALSNRVAADTQIDASTLLHIYLTVHLLYANAEVSQRELLRVEGLKVWSVWVAKVSEDQVVEVIRRVRSRIGAMISDVDTAFDVAALVQCALRTVNETRLPLSPLQEIIPPSETLDAALLIHVRAPVDPTLAILDPLVPSGISNRSEDISRNRDADGFSSYTRETLALLKLIAEDRQLGITNLWALRHVIALGMFAADFLAVPSAINPLFGSTSDKGELERIVRQAGQVTAYLTSSIGNEVSDEWHASTTKAILSPTPSIQVGADSARVIINVVLECKHTEGVQYSRILKTLLQGLLRGASKTALDSWLTLAQEFQKIALQTSLAISLTVASFSLNSPRADRYRNELASRLSGVPPGRAKTEGLRLMRKLTVAAPPSDSDIVFLPQQRAIFLLQNIQKWITGDEENEGEIEEQIADLLFHLAPIIQNVPGSHWDFAFDLIEFNLEAVSGSVDENLVHVARTLRLLIEVQELVLTNKSLRAVWKERSEGILSLVYKLFVESTDTRPRTLPRQTCRSMIVRIVQDLPDETIDEDSLPALCMLLADSNLDVQKVVYALLSKATKRRTSRFSIESAVATEQPAEQFELLQGLITIVRSPLQVDAPSVFPPSLTFTYLLAWSIIFDSFQDATPTVRAAYMEQLRNADVVPFSFLPNIFSFLDVGEGRKFVPLSQWAIEEFHISLYDEERFALQVFAAHIYYRALVSIPTLIRQWWLDCKDRQFSNAVNVFTTTLFSPLLIHEQLSHLKDPSSRAELTDESLTIKVALNVNEVTATYLVDEQQLEIGVRLPVNFPLQGVEVRDLKRVGVAENKWRGWLFNVQQGCQNGPILDALSIFKRNIALHFEGMVECAICYSIISVMDRSLPVKPCKTCKNKFHASCLYKWFHSSHSSSCPLCRSDIF